MKKKENLPKFAKIGGPGEMYSYPPVIRPGPCSLHFRGRRPIPRLPELASSSARPQAAALRDLFQDALAHEDGEEDEVVRLREAQDALPPNVPAVRPARRAYLDGRGGASAVFCRRQACLLYTSPSPRDA